MRFIRGSKFDGGAVRPPFNTGVVPPELPGKPRPQNYKTHRKKPLTALLSRPNPLAPRRGKPSNKVQTGIIENAAMPLDYVPLKPVPIIKAKTQDNSITDDFLKIITNGQANTLPEPETKKKSDPMLALYTKAVGFIMENLKVVAGVVLGLALLLYYLLKK